MTWIRLNSRRLAAAAYDAAHEKLEVRFRNGSTADHRGVTPAMFDSLITAESPGFYYHYYIEPCRIGQPRPSHRMLSYPVRLLCIILIYLASPLAQAL